MQKDKKHINDLDKTIQNMAKLLPCDNYLKPLGRQHFKYLHEPTTPNLTKHKQPDFIPELRLTDFSSCEFPEFPNYDFDFLQTELLRTEEQLITQVLEQLLKRKPTIEDFKLVTKAFYVGDNRHYKLLYNDMKLGWVTLPSFELNMHSPHFIGFTFKPCI